MKLNDTEGEWQDKRFGIVKLCDEKIFAKRSQDVLAVESLSAILPFTE